MGRSQGTAETTAEVQAAHSQLYQPSSAMIQQPSPLRLLEPDEHQPSFPGSVPAIPRSQEHL